MDKEKKAKLYVAIRECINANGIDNALETPDYILADHLVEELEHLEVLLRLHHIHRKPTNNIGKNHL